MAHLRNISIRGLFGLYDHDLDLRQEPPLTIVAGPNGVGKTTLLRLTTALLRGDYRELLRYEFVALSVENERGTTIEAEPVAAQSATSDSATVALRLRHGKQRPQHEELIEVPRSISELMPMPDFLERYDSESFIDVRDGEVIPEEDVAARSGMLLPSASIRSASRSLRTTCSGVCLRRFI